jgi:hypothetical protein
MSTPPPRGISDSNVSLARVPRTLLSHLGTVVHSGSQSSRCQAEIQIRLQEFEVVLFQNEFAPF